MLNKAYIKAISYYLPANTLSNETLEREFPEWNAEKISSKIGIRERHIADHDEYSSDMAVKAAKKLFQNHHIKRQEIDFVLLCTQSPDYFLPTTACIVQERLGIPVSAGAMDFNLGCSGYVYGLATAKGLIGAGIANNVLLITSETYSKFIHPGDKGNRAIFGDAASASLISTDGYAEILNFALGTDGKGAGNLIVKNGALRYPKTNAGDNGNFLFMDGMEIFNFTIERIPQLVSETLVKNDLSINNIDHFIFHQANKYILNHLRKKLGIEEKKFEIFMEHCGNTVSSTIPIVLSNLISTKSILNNASVLLVGFGVGYSWGACVLRYQSTHQ